MPHDEKSAVETSNLQYMVVGWWRDMKTPEGEDRHLALGKFHGAAITALVLENDKLGSELEILFFIGNYWED